MILVHDPWRRYRLHPDHRNAGLLVIDAVVAARDYSFFPDLPDAPHRPQALLLFEADQPNHVENISGWADTKVRALLAHRSQMESTFGISPDSVKDEPDDLPDDLLKIIEHYAHLHAQLASNISHGEAFHLMDEL